MARNVEIRAATLLARLIEPRMDLPSDDSLRWIVRAYAHLRAAHGDAIGDPPLVQPTAEFFPDEFRGDPASLARLVRRIISYTPIADGLPLELAFVADGSVTGGCGSPACGSTAGVGDSPHGDGTSPAPPGRGRNLDGTSPALPGRGRNLIEELDDGYRVLVAATDLGHPDLLTASLVRSIGAVLLCEAGEEIDGAVTAQRAEMAAAACGFGVALANGAAIWGKSCGGLRMVRGTALSVEEAAVALALFVALHQVKESQARVHLHPTQREAFDLALSWTASNPRIVGSLRDCPALLEKGAFDFEPARGLFGRWFHRRSLEKELRAAPMGPKRALSEESRRHFEEARALVEGTSLSPGGSDLDH